MTYRELIEKLKADGWQLDHTRGSHLQFRHPTKPGTVTVPAGGKMSRNVPTGTANSALRQAGLRR